MSKPVNLGGASVAELVGEGESWAQIATVEAATEKMWLS